MSDIWRLARQGHLWTVWWWLCPCEDMHIGIVNRDFGCRQQLHCKRNDSSYHDFSQWWIYFVQIVAGTPCEESLVIFEPKKIIKDCCLGRSLSVDLSLKRHCLCLLISRRKTVNHSASFYAITLQRGSFAKPVMNSSKLLKRLVAAET